MATPVEPNSQPLSGTAGERTIGQLVADVSTDLSQIVRTEVELAKAEIKADVTHAGKGIGMFAGAGVLALYGLGVLFLGLAGVIAIWLPWWAGLLIIAGVIFVIAGILALVGKKQVSQVQGKPQKTIAQAQETVDAIKAVATPAEPGTTPTAGALGTSSATGVQH